MEHPDRQAQDPNNSSVRATCTEFIGGEASTHPETRKTLHKASQQGVVSGAREHSGVPATGHAQTWREHQSISIRVSVLRVWTTMHQPKKRRLQERGSNCNQLTPSLGRIRTSTVLHVELQKNRNSFSDALKQSTWNGKEGRAPPTAD